MNRTKANAYNWGRELAAGHVTELTAAFQRARGLTVDGMLGPLTLAELDRAIAEAARPCLPERPDIVVSAGDWMVGPRVRKIAIDRSWFGAHLAAPTPRAIVWHYTATDANSAENMARRRVRPHDRAEHGAKTSWHVTIEPDGRIVQMIPLTAAGNHAGGDKARPIPGLGWANSHAVGIELVSLKGEDYPEAQVEAAARVARAICRAYPMPRELAGVGHRDIHRTKNDPGDEWMTEHLPRVLEYAYAADQ
jgi:hypothetical protein